MKMTEVVTGNKSSLLEEEKHTSEANDIVVLDNNPVVRLGGHVIAPCDADDRIVN